MLGFLSAAVVTFGLCWVWVGGYLADFVVWLISKLTPDSSNEKNLAYVIGAVFLVLGVVVALTTNGRLGSTAGGVVAGAGLYVAVRLPNRIRNKRLHRQAKAEAARPPVAPWPSPAPATPPRSLTPAPVVRQPPVAVPVPVAVTSAPALEVDWLPADGGGASQSDGQREAAWREVHDRGTSAARLAEIAGRYPEFGPAMVDHPQAYPELREWIHRLPGDTGEAGTA